MGQVYLNLNVYEKNIRENVSSDWGVVATRWGNIP